MNYKIKSQDFGIKVIIMSKVHHEMRFVKKNGYSYDIKSQDYGIKI